MERSLRIAVLVAVACSLVVASRARADFDRHCEERPLDAAEQAAAARAASALRTALPDAPTGWKVLDDTERVSAIACEVVGKTWAPGGKLVPQPVSVYVHRKYLRSGPPPAVSAETAPPPVKAAAAAGPDTARRKELEARLAELQRSRKDAVREYQEARQARDGAAQQTARRRDQELALAMRPVQEELSKLRRAESGARAAESEARTAVAVAHARAVEERRTDASVSITANLAWVQLHGAEVFDAPGADVAIRKSGGVVLLVGPWSFGRGEGAAGAKIDDSAPRTRVQTIAVEIAGNPAAAEALRGKIGVAGLRRLVGG